VKKIIGLSGYAGSGKDEAARALIARGWLRVAFADPLRECLLALNPIIAESHPSAAGPYRLRECVERHGWQVAKQYSEVRQLLQRMGTEVGREIIDNNLWLNIAARTIDASSVPGVVITDVRFSNEARFIHERGGLIVRISRPGIVAPNGHISEAMPFEPDAVIQNSGTIEQLHARMLGIIADRWPRKTIPAPAV
jgi:hypothetical protein